ncbi:MAG TPA: tyrosine-type recombinase/integrase [Ktedonobacteraceae bacterium]|nr:tyrosine-type recombinase/integrase [Ktedonobacteraceae bacterium]
MLVSISVASLVEIVVVSLGLTIGVLAGYYGGWLKKAGLPDMRLHDLRHSIATILLSMGVHPKVVQELLGHNRIQETVDTYSQVLSTIHREAIKKLEDVLWK